MNEKLRELTTAVGWFRLEPYAYDGPHQWRITDQSQVDGYLEWEYFGATPEEAVNKAHAAFCSTAAEFAALKTA